MFTQLPKQLANNIMNWVSLCPAKIVFVSFLRNIRQIVKKWQTIIRLFEMDTVACETYKTYVEIKQITFLLSM